jgi:glycosyltransferase involved in cell wall biosynthesis
MLSDRSDVHRVLICAPRLPEFDRQSGERRCWHLVNALLQSGWSVTFVATQTAAADAYVRILRQLGVATYLARPGTVEEVVQAERFDVALLVFWEVAEEYIPVIRSLSPGTRIVVDSVDLHWLRNARRHLQRAADGEQFGLRPEHGTEMVRELNVYGAADAVLTVSEKEATLINDLVLDHTRAHVVPDGEELELSTITRAERQGILFVGNFSHPPNVEGLQFLCEEVLPRIDRKILDRHPVQIVGNRLDERVSRYGHSLPYVRIIGWVPSVIPYLQRACISVVPLLHGAGTKRKLIQTLMLGTPAVTTSLGTEGLDLLDAEHVLIADEASAFAASVEQLVTNEDLWHRLRTNGAEHVRRSHCLVVAQQRLMDALDEVMASSPAKVTKLKASA